MDVKIYSSLEFGTVAEVKSKGIKSISIDSVSLLERLNITLSTLTHQNQTFPFSPPMSTLNHIALQSSLSSMSSSSHPPPRRYGPLLSIFSSNLPLKLIVGTLGSQVKRNHLRSIALKITRDAYVYGKIDCEILDDVEVIDDETVEGNIVLIGGGRDNLLGRVWGVDWKVDGVLSFIFCFGLYSDLLNQTTHKKSDFSPQTASQFTGKFSRFLDKVSFSP